MFLLNFSVILGHPKFASCLGGAQRVLVGSCKVLAMHLNVYAGVTIKTKTCPIGHLKTVCIGPSFFVLLYVCGLPKIRKPEINKS